VSKKKKGQKKSSAPPTPAPSPRRAVRFRGKWIAGLALVTILGGVAGAVYFLREPVVIPVIDVSKMEPQVAKKISDYREAVAAHPRSGEAWGKLGMVLQAHGLDREASECYRYAVERDPKEFRWLYLRAHSLRELDPKKALEEAERALELDRSYAPAHVLEAEILEEQGETKWAITRYRTAFEADPTNTMAAFGAGRLYLANGDMDKAQGLLEKAEELDPEAGAIHASLAQLYRRLGEADKAQKEAALAFEKKSPVGIADPIHFEMRQESVSSLVQLERARKAAESGDFATAEKTYRDLVELRPDDADMHARLGDVYAQEHQLSQAKEQYQEALARNPKHVEAHYGLGTVLNLEGRYDEAIEQYRASLEGKPDHVPTLVNLGALLAYQGKTAEAEEAFQKALQVEPEAFAPNRQLGELSLKAREYDAAIAYFRKALKTEPDSGPVHLELAVALASVRKFGSALEHARKAEELGQPMKPGFIAQLEKLAARSGAS
jgi:tetratricopeptide (TPR) repeat protein